MNTDAEKGQPEEEPETEAEDRITDLQLDTLSGDLRDAMLMQFRDVNTAWSAMSEERQRELGAAMELAAKDLVRKAVRLLTDHSFARCVVQLGEIKIVGGDKSRIEGKIVAHNVSENREVLGDHVNTTVQLVCIDSTEFMGERGPANVDPDQPDLPGTDGGEADPADPVPSDMMRKARDVILKEQTASTSLVQRRLAIGYNKAARIMEALEEEGFVSAPDAEGKRTIIGEEGEEPDAA